jgi:flagellar biosynthesis protein FlhG
VSTKTLCIASGKGGVGKTTLSINLAVTLAETGLKVLYFDADMGLANAQIGLGSESVLNISHVVNGLVPLSQIVAKTAFGVDLVTGGSGISELADVNKLQAAEIIRMFSGLPDAYDVLIVDCAAGISPSVLAFMQGCQQRVVVGTKDLSSIADAYALMKVLANDFHVDDFIYLPNMVDNERQGLKLFESMNSVVQNFLSTRLHYVGSVPHEALVDTSWRKSTPLIKLAPSSMMSTALRRIAGGLMTHQSQPYAAGGVQFFMERA